MTDRLRERWLQASSRERMLLALGAVIVVGAIGYALVWQPLVRDLDANETALGDARARADWARKAVDELPGLGRTAKTPLTANPRGAVERVAGARQLRSAITALDTQDGRVRVTFAAVDFDALVAFLDALAREEQLFLAEGLLAARVAPGSVRAELSLTRPAPR